MPDAISNTSPLIYLHRIAIVEWLPLLFSSIWVPSAVVEELREGQRRGFDVPTVDVYPWLQIVDPTNTPSEWLSLDLGPGELATMALALEQRNRVVLLDDLLARRTAQAAGLTVWGTLKILLGGPRLVKQLPGNPPMSGLCLRFPRRESGSVDTNRIDKTRLG